MSLQIAIDMLYHVVMPLELTMPSLKIAASNLTWMNEAMGRTAFFHYGDTKESLAELKQQNGEAATRIAQKMQDGTAPEVAALHGVQKLFDYTNGTAYHMAHGEFDQAQSDVKKAAGWVQALATYIKPDPQGPNQYRVGGDPIYAPGLGKEIATNAVEGKGPSWLD